MPNINQTVVDSTVLERAVVVARDVLADYRGEYVFFKTSVFDTNTYMDAYLLIMCDKVTMWDRNTGFTLQNTLHNPMKFCYISFEHNSIDYDLYDMEFSLFQVDNPGKALVYSSVEGYPHLQEGGVYYGYMQAVCIIGVCVFVLFDRILRHIR